MRLQTTCSVYFAAAHTHDLEVEQRQARKEETDILRGARGGLAGNHHRQGRQKYLLNAYRVSVDACEAGNNHFVPHGDESDPTRAPAFYDDTYVFTRLAVADG